VVVVGGSVGGGSGRGRGMVCVGGGGGRTKGIEGPIEKGGRGDRSKLLLLLLRLLLLFAALHSRLCTAVGSRPRTDDQLMARALAAAGIRGAARTPPPALLLPRFKNDDDNAATAPGVAGGGDCLGLVRKSCAPCPPPEQNQAGNAGGCDLLDAMCDNSFCDPLCLNKVIDCKVEPPSDAQFKVLGSKEVEAALCAEFKAHACATAKCCDKDAPMLQSWVEEDTYGTGWPEPLMLVEACKHDPDDAAGAKKICDQCKKAVKGKIKVKPFKKEDVCEPMASWEGRLNGDGHEDKGNYWTPYNVKFGFPFIGPHKPLLERCEGLVLEMEGHLSGLKSAFEAGACHCLGCCDPVDKCWFPVVE
jgi:hypothetical protein